MGAATVCRMAAVQSLVKLARLLAFGSGWKSSSIAISMREPRMVNGVVEVCTMKGANEKSWMKYTVIFTILLLALPQCENKSSLSPVEGDDIVVDDSSEDKAESLPVEVRPNEDDIRIANVLEQEYDAECAPIIPPKGTEQSVVESVFGKHFRKLSREAGDDSALLCGRQNIHIYRLFLYEPHPSSKHQEWAELLVEYINGKVDNAMLFNVGINCGMDYESAIMHASEYYPRAIGIIRKLKSELHDKLASAPWNKKD
ncbi:MAG: hypothetical protein V1861_03955 [Candidatus Micrarchaeota archaeon]